MSIKIKLLELGKKQVDLIEELRNRGFTIQPPELSTYINQIMITPKSERVLRACDEIIEDWIAEQENTGR